MRELPYDVRIESIHSADGVLIVRCAGTVGIGSESAASLRPVGEALAGWIREHRDHHVQEIVVDFTDLDYRWGDGPVACFIPFVREGVQRIRFIANTASAQALESLLVAANLPWFAVERADA